MVKQSLWWNCDTIWTQTQLHAQTDKLGHLDAQTASLFSDKMPHYVPETVRGTEQSGGFFSNFMPRQWVFKSEIMDVRMCMHIGMNAQTHSSCLFLKIKR